MIGIHDLPLFIGAGLALNLTPGADVAVIVARSAAQGFRAGAAVALGVGVGCAVHVLAAALGVSALLASSPWAFEALRWLGAAYLAWLGVGLWLGSYRAATPAEPTSANTAKNADADAKANANTNTNTTIAADAMPASRPSTNRLPLRQAFVQGFLTNALNPKVALFFLAFVPQFVSADAPQPAASFALLGLIFAFNGTLVNLGFAWAAVALRRRLGSAGWAGRWLSRAAGLLFIAMALKLALGGVVKAAEGRVGVTAIDLNTGV